MSKSGKPPAQAGIGHNSLDGYVEDFHALDRNDVFEKGVVLLKARDTHDYLNWKTVCDEKFGISHDTARNLMAVAKVAEKYEKIRTLRVKRSTLYKLAGAIGVGPNYSDHVIKDDPEPDHENLPSIVEALAEAGKERTLSIGAADGVIHYARLRKKFGDDFPEATLDALDQIEEDWPEAVAQIKEKKPATAEDADAILIALRRADVAAIYEVDVAVLPAWLDDEMLVEMADTEIAPAEYRERLLQKLQNTSEEQAQTAFSYISDVIDEFKQAEGTNDKGATTGEKGTGEKSKATSRRTALVEEIKAKAIEGASSEKGRATTGEKGKATSSEKNADVKALTKKITQLEKAVADRDREIKNLKAQLETAPTGKADKLAAELVKSLKKGSSEAKELAVEQIVNGLGLGGLAPCKAIIVNALKTVDRKVAETTLAKMAKDIGIDMKKAA
jgi:hypothetical protein